MDQCKVTALANQKGGVGKTVSTVNLGVGLARAGKKVLLVDADPQGSLTISLGVKSPDELDTTLTTVMQSIVEEKPPPADYGIIHHNEGVDFIPANIELAAFEVGLTSVLSREYVLREALEPLRERYDHILIDCMPSLHMVTVNALTAADSVIIPSQPNYLSTKGLSQLMGTIARVKRQLNPGLTLCHYPMDDSWTEKMLHITITPKTAEDMKSEYGFTEEQDRALSELLSDRAALLELIGNLTFIGADAEAIILNLPDNLSEERREVVKVACSLVGKVNYFWGGKSLVLGWDSRWGTLQKVWADGNSTTGTYRPYGLDCSGFVDWVFYNMSDGAYVIGHGGGATMQHSYCDPIPWGLAQPGDLVFYPEDSHVGIVGGRDENGDLLIIHCASGYNGTVITGLSGFTAIGRPQYYSG